MLDMVGDLAVDPGRITLEITEQALLGDLDLGPVDLLCAWRCPRDSGGVD